MSRIDSDLGCSSLQAAQLWQQGATQPATWLGALRFGSDAGDVASAEMSASSSGITPVIDSGSHAGLPLLPVVMPRLVESGAGDCDFWHAATPVRHGREAGLHYGFNDHWLFGAIVLDEGDFVQAGSSTGDASAQASATPLQRAAESAYGRIFALADRLGFSYLLRCWNYLADINGHSHGIERYRQFNRGRHDAFLQSRRHVTGNVPAACALGLDRGPLRIAFLASRTAPVPIENARQVSAYRYPEQYGPRSPTFSRANLFAAGDATLLCISGTASIVGHQTMHPGDVAAQTRETLANIAVLVDEANRTLGKAAFTLPVLTYRVYLRHAGDLAVVQQTLKELLGPAMHAVIFRADICRADLLVEIEATARHPGLPAGID